MPEIKFFPETHVAFVAEIGPYHASVQRGFKKLFDWLDKHHIRPVGESLAIFYDDPSQVAAANLRCDLCAPVGPHVTGSDDVRTKEIGGWQVATVIYQGEANAAGAYDEVYRWLREQGYHEADAPIEKYLSQLGEELRAEVAVPILPKDQIPAPTEKRATRAAGKPAAGRRAAGKPASATTTRRKKAK